jgi:hypothetical protein
MHKYLIGIADAPEGAADFSAEVRKMENKLIFDGVDDDLCEKFIWKQQHHAGIIKKKGRK